MATTSVTPNATPEVQASQGKPRSLWEKMKEYRWSYAFIAPYMLIFIIFTVIPVIWAMFLSLTYYNMIQPPVWVGFENYARLFTDDQLFYLAVKNTFYFSIVTGPLGYCLSLILAWLINEVKYRKLYTLIYYIPSITSGVAMAVIWMYLYNGSKYGLLNYLLLKWGIIEEPVLWLKNVKTTLPAIMITSIWMSMGTSFLVFIAALQGVPHELYEAALIDGATRWQEFWHITLPMIRPALLFGAVMTVVSSFQVFDLTMVMAGFPSTLYCAHTIVGHLYDYAFLRFEMGYASAIAIVLFLMTFIISSVLRKVLSSKDL